MSVAITLKHVCASLAIKPSEANADHNVADAATGRCSLYSIGRTGRPPNDRGFQRQYTLDIDPPHRPAVSYFPSNVLTGTQSGPGGWFANALARLRNSADGLSTSATRSKHLAAASNSRIRQCARPWA